MSVEQADVIDFISCNADNEIVLTISDHLEWNLSNEHLHLLQKKIYAYLDAIDNGSIYSQYPDAKDKDFLIQVLTKYHPNKQALKFMSEMRAYIQTEGHEFSNRMM